MYYRTVHGTVTDIYDAALSTDEDTAIVGTLDTPGVFSCRSDYTGDVTDDRVPGDEVLAWDAGTVLIFAHGLDLNDALDAGADLVGGSRGIERPHYILIDGKKAGCGHARGGLAGVYIGPMDYSAIDPPYNPPAVADVTVTASDWLAAMDITWKEV